MRQRQARRLFENGGRDRVGRGIYLLPGHALLRIGKTQSGRQFERLGEAVVAMDECGKVRRVDRMRRRNRALQCRREIGERRHQDIVEILAESREAPGRVVHVDVVDSGHPVILVVARRGDAKLLGDLLAALIEIRLLYIEREQVVVDV